MPAQLVIWLIKFVIVLSKVSFATLIILSHSSGEGILYQSYPIQLKILAVMRAVAIHSSGKMRDKLSNVWIVSLRSQ